MICLFPFAISGKFWEKSDRIWDRCPLIEAFIEALVKNEETDDEAMNQSNIDQSSNVFGAFVQFQRNRWSQLHTKDTHLESTGPGHWTVELDLFAPVIWG